MRGLSAWRSEVGLLVPDHEMGVFFPLVLARLEAARAVGVCGAGLAEVVTGTIGDTPGAQCGPFTASLRTPSCAVFEFSSHGAE